MAVVWVGTKNHGRTAEQVTGGFKATVQLVNSAAAPGTGSPCWACLFGASAPTTFERKTDR